MPEIYSSIACNLDSDIISAIIPLLGESRVQAIEWSFDALYGVEEVPAWFTNLLKAYSDEGRLIGHGVFFSLFSGRWSYDQQNWLNELKRLSSLFKFDHISEHYGFMTGKSFHDGAPLSIPYSKTALNIGRDRLARIYDACRCPVGLENLAFSYSLDEVKNHGEFLEQLIEPINGFMILDLHNLYCQMHNFSIGFDEIIDLYPLNRVREIHISGGSWEDSSFTKNRIRRDTHDNAVPAEVFELLKSTITLCPNLKFVVLEQMGTGLKTERSRALFYNDFLTMESIVLKSNSLSSNEVLNKFLPVQSIKLSHIIQDELLFRQQEQLSSILETAASYYDAVTQLKNSSLANTEWKIESWQPYMLETAISIAQKWKVKEVL